MEDEVNSFAGGLYAGGVLKIHLVKRDSVANIGEIIEVPRGEIVDAAHFVPLLDKRVSQG
jgi:hypothetical protein